MSIAVRVVFNRLPEIAMKLPMETGAVVGKTALDIQTQAQSTVSVDTGNLKNSIRAQPRGLLTWIVATNVIYAAIHEFGGHIRARNRPYLMFRGRDGGFVRVKSVYRPARPYLVPAAERARPAFAQAMLSLLSRL